MSSSVKKIDPNSGNQNKYIESIVNDFLGKDTQTNIETNSVFGSTNIDENVNLSHKLMKANNKSFLKSNFKKFLHFAKLMGVKVVRMVSHSQTMRDFVKFCYENNKQIVDKIDATADSQNAWSMFLKTNNTVFIVSRHAYSVANFLKDSKQPLAMIREPDPSLTLWGILTTIYRSNGLHQEEVEYLKDKPELHNPSHIHVSILIRTWMSAVCLYLGHVTTGPLGPSGTPGIGKIFKLIVSPYIKEEGKTKDNTPLQINEQLAKFAGFFDYLVFLSD